MSSYHAWTHAPKAYGGTDPLLPLGRYEIKVFPDEEMATIMGLDMPVETGDGLFIFAIPEDLHLSHLRRAEGFVTTAGAGATVVQIRNVTQAHDMLTTKITIDSGETSSSTATQAVVTVANDLVEWGDLIAIDVDSAGTDVWGLGVMLVFAK